MRSTFSLENYMILAVQIFLSYTRPSWSVFTIFQSWSPRESFCSIPWSLTMYFNIRTPQHCWFLYAKLKPDWGNAGSQCLGCLGVQRIRSNILIHLWPYPCHAHRIPPPFSNIMKKKLYFIYICHKKVALNLAMCSSKQALFKKK